ncbi:thiol:disulfide interchange protein DsbD [Tamilnaduibacter salinus]|uniref:Thiol:disulfide interchange protein DsbD n=1 Tax=Tamilnaduibacter salinus TaxID=1484056 RepID=A0A2A2I6J7_9GAMM|nr:protein-disulfide reductase DsbD [Tamilnaduibacter salinus]PAV26750.1 thiol:disulfide interchange protein [Tamilnaduibacter salinus]PVY75361.1 thiol:disulfide interchange protein DsbD [Tamilnaduibacter salinus]
MAHWRRPPHSLTMAQHLMALVLVALCLPVHALDLGQQKGAGDFLPVDQAFPFETTLTDSGLSLHWDVTPGHYLYQGRVQVRAPEAGVSVSAPRFSRAGEDREDPYFGQVTVFTEPATAHIDVTLPADKRETTLKVTYQGCAEAGLCYPPETRDVLYIAGDSSAPSSGSDSKAPASAGLDTATGLAALLSEQSLLVAVGLFFLLGLGLTFTPCVLPMIPIVATVVSSRNTRTTAQALTLAISYVLGMALTYAAAGAVTGLLGASFNVQAQLQQPWVLITFAAFFAVFAMAMFGLYDIQLPAALRNRLDSASRQLSGGRLAGVFGIGALSALIVSPCVSAPLAGSLLYISATQNAILGGIVLFAMALGMGVPLILVAVGGQRFLPTSGPWMMAVKALYGWLLLGVAVWLLERLLPGWTTLLLWGALLIGIALHLGTLEPAATGWPRFRKGVGVVVLLYAVSLFAGGLAGASDPFRPLAPFTATPPVGDPASGTSQFETIEQPAALQQALHEAAQQDQPVMLEFYADWCITCKTMERNVFSRASVRQALTPYRLLRIDVTDNTPAQQALLEELGLFGPPAILFHDASGRELSQFRVLGDMGREAFLDHLAALPVRERS